MKLRLALLFVSLLALCAASLPAMSPAQAEVSFAQTVRLVGQKPVSGRFVNNFTNYGESMSGATCKGCIRVARGRVATKANAYKVAEGMQAYDYFFLDLDIDVTDHSGSSRLGAMYVKVGTGNATIYDIGDSRSISADAAECRTLHIGLSQSLGVISASTDLGTVRYCDEEAALTRIQSGNPAIWRSTRLAKTHYLSIQRIVKVKAGQRPIFNVSYRVPTDSCTSTYYSLGCNGFRDLWTHRSFSVGTSGI